MLNSQFFKENEYQGVSKLQPLGLGTVCRQNSGMLDVKGTKEIEERRVVPELLLTFLIFDESGMRNTRL